MTNYTTSNEEDFYEAFLSRDEDIDDDSLYPSEINADDYPDDVGENYPRR